MTRDEKMAEISNAFLTQSLLARLILLIVPSPLNWKTSRKQNEAPVFQAEMVSNLIILHTTWTIKNLQDQMRCMQEMHAGRNAHQETFNNVLAFLSNWEVHS